jgi:copper transporter 1
MLFTWSTHNLCIVFRQWHITGPVSLLLSLAAIVLLTAGYEGVREISRQYEQSHSAKMAAFSSSASSTFQFSFATTLLCAHQAESWQGEAAPPNETSSLLGVGRDGKELAERKGKLVKAALYAVQVFYSFFIM